jgi:entericidin B
MRGTTKMLAFSFVALFGAALLLSACNTTAGVGEDMSAGGQAIKRSAEKHAP